MPAVVTEKLKEEIVVAAAVAVFVVPDPAQVVGRKGLASPQQETGRVAVHPASSDLDRWKEPQPGSLDSLDLPIVGAVKCELPRLGLRVDPIEIDPHVA